ncbi:arsenate reductase family protein [Octadecabacter antarcticus]|nr:hypothetical protein [Octadecabacter antarcticus]
MTSRNNPANIPQTNRKPKHMILYGLPTCSDCNRARKDLANAGHDLAFCDVRADLISEDKWL